MDMCRLLSHFLQCYDRIVLCLSCISNDGINTNLEGAVTQVKIEDCYYFQALAVAEIKTDVFRTLIITTILFHA